MMNIEDLFEIQVAKSKSTDDYEAGTIPFITNAEINNGVVKYVEPLDGDKVFDGPAICVSGLGYATLQLTKFLPKGNGGDSCSILIPKSTMSKLELLYYAALFNVLHKWRFSFGRKSSKERLRYLQMDPLFNESKVNFDADLEFVSQVIDVDTKRIKQLIVSQK